MALVGDLIFRTRSKIPDLPLGVVPPPTISNLFQSQVTGFTYLPAPQTYYIVVCWITPWGLSLPSAEQNISLTPPNNSIGINLGQDIFQGGPITPPQTSTFVPNGVTGLRVYIGTSAGAENHFFDVNPILNTFPVISIAPNLGTPPLRSTAYLMDTDGKMFGAGTVYDWLNDALVSISRGVGGLLDYAGVPTVAGQPLYKLPGEWVEISDVWYGGYWVQGGRRGDFFRRSTVTSQILNNVTVSVFTGKQIMELSYQPDRTAGTCLTTADMLTQDDTSVAIDNPGAFLLDFGFAQISSSPAVTYKLAPEIVAYSSHSPNLTGLVRGLGATGAQVWPANSIVTEFPLFWCGKRLFSNKYYAGQSFVPLDAPVGWESAIPLYMLAQAKRAELDVKTATEMEKQAIEMAKEYMSSNRGVARFVQVGGYGAGNTLRTFDQTVAGGIIIP